MQNSICLIADIAIGQVSDHGASMLQKNLTEHPERPTLSAVGHISRDGDYAYRHQFVGFGWAKETGAIFFVDSICAASHDRQSCARQQQLRRERRLSSYFSHAIASAQRDCTRIGHRFVSTSGNSRPDGLRECCAILLIVKDRLHLDRKERVQPCRSL